MQLQHVHIHFRCRACFEIGHLTLNCKKFLEKIKEIKTHRNPTRWIGENIEHQCIGKDQDAEEILAVEKSSEPSQQTVGSISNSLSAHEIVGKIKQKKKIQMFHL